MISQSIDLELSLHHRDDGPYTAELRSNWPDSDVDPLSGRGREVHFDFDELAALETEPAQYGLLLASNLFADKELYADFSSARTAAQTKHYTLRLQLLIGSDALNLHKLHWETLRDLQDDTPLFTGENISFSRYLLGSSDWRPVRTRAKGELRALIAVANPQGLERYPGYAPVNVAEETARARQGLGTIKPATLLEFGTQRCSLNNLIACLRQDQCDLVYLVCHGSSAKDDSKLWLESDTGQLQHVTGQELVTEIKNLAQRPLVMVLAACDGAREDGPQALTKVGPRLAEAGVPVVVAMQGRVSMSTVAQFMPVFFNELQRDGRIERAMAVARGVVGQRPDYWMPVLFTRLKSGRIWYVPGFRGAFDKWDTLVNSIRKGKCTPILGTGLNEPLLGSMREIALDWADKFGFPMAPHERESLPQVAQFVAVNKDRSFLRDQLSDYLQHEIQTRYTADLPAALQTSKATLDQLIEAVYAVRWQREPDEPHRLLAQLPLPIYITANVNNLLARALKEAGKDPQVVVCPWYRKAEEQKDSDEEEEEKTQEPQTIFEREPNYTPDEKRPLVYHLFGRLGLDDSLVITEDDYFDYLIGVSRNWQLIPKRVLQRLANSPLLFLGFRLDDWTLRTFLRLIMVRQEGALRRGLYTHISAQIQPEEDRLLKPERAQKYLEDYFQKGTAINLYWGSTAEFLKELQSHLNEQAG
jgi:hypothetical protein